MPLFLGNTYSSREKGTGGLQLLSKTQRNYAYLNMWTERNKTNGGECKQWVNLVKGKRELFVLFLIVSCTWIWSKLTVTRKPTTSSIWRRDSFRYWFFQSSPFRRHSTSWRVNEDTEDKLIRSEADIELVNILGDRFRIWDLSRMETLVQNRA